MTISTRDLSLDVAGRMILNGVAIDVARGSTFGLLGPNGSGKSSLLRLIAGLRGATSGVVTLDEVDIASLTRRAVARRVAFVEQQSTTETNITALDVVRLGRTPHRGPISPWTSVDDEAVEKALNWVGMSGRCQQSWHTLSGGERQRLQIARALAQSPSELLLDEPSNHLDIQHQLELLTLIRNLPATCIVALHDLNLAAMFCDTVAVLQGGKIVEVGPVKEVLREKLIRKVFNVDVRVEQSPFHGRPYVHYLGVSTGSAVANM